MLQCCPARLSHGHRPFDRAYARAAKAYAPTMGITPSELRRDIYRLLDGVLDSGTPLEVERGGRLLHIVAVERSGNRLSRIRGRADGIVGDPDDLVEIDWSEHWRPQV